MKEIPCTALAILLISSTADAQSWTWNWVRKQGNAGHNDPLCVNPLNTNTIYGSPGNSVIVVSYDRGRTWQTLATVSGGSQIKALEVNSRDTTVLLVAQEATSPSDRIMKSTNNGATWTQTLSGGMYYWGHPLAYEPSLGDETVYTMAGSSIYRSSDFGSSWNTVGAANPFGSGNGGWEDAFVRPDSSNILIVSDNATGIWKSTDYGSTWRHVYVASGEVPALALNLQNPAIAYGTKWGGGGGFVKTTNFGETWQAIPQFNGLNTWGVAVSRTDPSYVTFATWGPSFTTTGGFYISRDGGTIWERTFQGLQSNSNHACFVIDTLTVLSLWSDGIWKLLMPGGISGTVFNDYNGNGVRETGEPGMQNWKVLMTGSRVDSVFTDSGGLYSFKGLTAGTYTVTAQVPTGWNPTGPPGGSYLVSVTDGEQYPGRDFGANQGAMLAVSVPNGGEIWPVGSAQTITWNSLNLSGNVTIELSRNAGGSYEMLFPNAANDGSESWTVTSPLSSQALVRISSIDVPSVSDASDNVFTITSALSFLSQITLHDNTALESAGDTLHFGIAPGATDGIDPAFGEEELPPRPPAGAFDVRWEIAGTQGSKRDIRDTLGQMHTQVVYTGLLQAGVGGYPFWLRWESAGLPTGVFTLRDKLTGGSYFAVNMKSQDSLVITNSAIPSFEIVYTEGASVNHSVQSGWNVVSLPVTVGIRQKSAVFPTAGSEAFGFGPLGYEVRDTLQYGEGYWIKFLTAQTLTLTGGTRSRDTIDVEQGWNMIGSITDPVPVDSIVQIPSGVVASQYFGYGATGYVTAGVIEPMQGYWVKASQNGKLVLSQSGARRSSSLKTRQR